ncbi:MAG: restriction endonuclease subunit S [Bacteroidales bacterium]|nr:restriction endonuclease subunit S [Candidatus Colimorpha onthohippi]
MSEWKKVKLGEVITLQRGYDLPKAKFKNGNIPVITSTSIMGYHNVAKEKGPGVITGRSGTIGQVQYVESDYWPHNTSLFVKDFKGNHPKFIYYFLKDFDPSRAMTGSAVPTLNRNNLAILDVIIPPLTTQHRIATILSRYDSLIESYQKQIKLLEEAAQRLYKEWFIDLHFPGHENTPIIDGIPEGWEKKKLGELFSFVRGKSYTSKELSDEGTIMVNLKNIQAFGGYKSDAEKHFLGSFKEDQTLVKGNLVMGVTDMTQERRLVGSVALIPDFKELATFSMDLIKLVSFKLPNVYLYCAMRYGDISRQIAPLANGVNVLHLKPEAINNIEMVVASDSVIEKFVSYTSKTIDCILTLQSQLRLLTEARDRLLPKLMSGEIEV